MAEGYSQVFSDVDFKRLEVLADFTEQRDRIFESVPEIKDIEEEIRTLGADSARAIIKKDDGKKAEIKKKIEVNENGLRKYSKKNPPKSRGKGKCNQPGTLYDETAFYIKR